jgi:hypothetical protein
VPFLQEAQGAEMFTPEEMIHSTDSLEQLPRTSYDHRSAHAERRQQIIHQKYVEKQTDALPSLTSDTTGALSSSPVTSPVEKATWRQVVQLREENRCLRAELETLRAQIKESDTEKPEMQQSSTPSSDETAPWLRQLFNNAEARMHLSSDKQLAELLYLKREVKRMVGSLEQERQQLSEERQHVIALQQSVREQATLREKALNARLRARWRVVSVSTSVGLLALLVVLQFVCLTLFHVPAVTGLTLALLTPIIICVGFAFVLASPMAHFKTFYEGVPRRIKKH